MFPKKIAIFIFCFICDSSFAQDSVFHIRKKLQEKHVFNQNQEVLITDLVSRDETAYQEANFDFYGDFLSRKLHSYGDVDLRFGGKCLQDLLIVLQDMAVGERYALMIQGLGNKGICVPHTCTAQDLQEIFNGEDEGSGNDPQNLPDGLECVEDIPWIVGDYVTLAICGIVGLALFVGTFHDIVLRYKRNKPDSEETTTPKNRSIELKSYQPREGHVYATSNGIPKSNPNGALNGHAAVNGHVSTDLENKDATFSQPAKILQVSNQKNFRDGMPLSFSLLTNGEKLFNFCGNGGELQAINGLRALSFGWVILGHSFTFLYFYIDNLAVIDTILARPAYQLILSGLYAVDTFFFLSGLLVAFSTLKLLHKTKGRLNWVMFYIHRYLRLTILYGFTILLMATLWRHVVKGIFQNKIDEGRQAEVDPVACQKYWWTNILYINNFYPNSINTNTCHAVGWYMANDMQFFIISPIYIYLLYKKRVVGHLLVLVGIVTSFMANGIISSKYDVTSLMFGSEPLNEDQMYYSGMMYIRPYYRMGAYLVGISAGEFLLHKPKLNKVCVCVGWTVALGLHYLLIFGMYPYYRDGRISMSTEMDALYNATHRTIRAIGLAWIVYACAHGLGGPINWFLSWNIWGPISRLSFAGYLCHPMVMYAIIANLQVLIHLNDHSAAMVFMASIAAVLPVSAVLSLAIEAPVMRLQKLLLGSKG